MDQAIRGAILLQVKGLDSDADIAKLVEGIGSLEGVVSVEIDRDEGKVIVRWGDRLVRAAVVVERIQSLGYQAS
jgi:hypothetical protein